MEAAHREGEPLFPPPVTEGRYMDLGTRAAKFQARAMRQGRWMSYLMGHRNRGIGVVEEALADAGADRRGLSRGLLHSLPEPTATPHLASLGHALDPSPWGFAATRGPAAPTAPVLALHPPPATGPRAP